MNETAPTYAGAVIEELTPAILVELLAHSRGVMVSRIIRHERKVKSAKTTHDRQFHENIVSTGKSWLRQCDRVLEHVNELNAARIHPKVMYRRAQ